MLFGVAGKRLRWIVALCEIGLAILLAWFWWNCMKGP